MIGLLLIFIDLLLELSGELVVGCFLCVLFLLFVSFELFFLLSPDLSLLVVVGLLSGITSLLLIPLLE